jgi:hypothetical protein
VPVLQRHPVERAEAPTNNTILDLKIAGTVGSTALVQGERSRQNLQVGWILFDYSRLSILNGAGTVRPVPSQGSGSLCSPRPNPSSVALMF